MIFFSKPNLFFQCRVMSQLSSNMQWCANCKLVPFMTPFGTHVGSFNSWTSGATSLWRKQSVGMVDWKNVNKNKYKSENYSCNQNFWCNAHRHPLTSENFRQVGPYLLYSCFVSNSPSICIPSKRSLHIHVHQKLSLVCKHLRFKRHEEAPTK